MNIDLEKLLDPVCDLSVIAGQKILDIYDSDYSVQQKQDDSPLTAADLAAHEVIVAGLKKLTPDIPVLSEESAAIPYEERRQWQEYWLVDPLDGTKEFINRNGEFTVNIALISGDSPVLGVVHVPVKGVTYLGSTTAGAYRREEGAAPRAIQVRPLAAVPVVVGSRSHRGESLNAFLERMGEHELVSMGSSLKFCLVADGSADIYPRLGPTSEWDTAAAQAVVEAAGGRVVTLDMQPLQYNRKDSLLNPHFLVIGDVSHDWSAYL